MCFAPMPVDTWCFSVLLNSVGLSLIPNFPSNEGETEGERDTLYTEACLDKSSPI